MALRVTLTGIWLISPLGREHINLTGDYRWDTSRTLGPNEFRPLRTHAHDFAAAA
jgi:hypothetical protein